MVQPQMSNLLRAENSRQPEALIPKSPLTSFSSSIHLGICLVIPLRDKILNITVKEVKECKKHGLFFN